MEPARLLCPWNSPGKNTGVGKLFLSPGDFPTEGLNPGLLHCRQILYLLSHQGGPIQYKSFRSSEALYTIHFIDLCGFGWGREDETILESHPSWKGWFLFISLFIYFNIWLYLLACGILAPQPGTEPTPAAGETSNLNNWTAREVPRGWF